MQALVNPEFVIFTGPMFSGKSTAMFIALERYKYQQKQAVVFKPRIDDRYAVDEIVSHNNLRQPAVSISYAAEVITHLSSLPSMPAVVCVDEAFMINGISETLIWLYRSGITVLVSTLDISAAGKPFEEVKTMLPWATKVVKCTAVCTVCGADAHYTHKKVVSEHEVEVGGVELYEARCMTHHMSVRIV